MMRAIVLLLVFTMALAVRAADNSDDDDATIAPGGHPARLKGIDEDVQRQAVDPEEEPEAAPELTDPYADDPDADDETLPEDRPEFDPDTEPAQPVDVAPSVDGAKAVHDAPAKKSTMYDHVLDSPLKDSPLKESPLHTGDSPGAAKGGAKDADDE